MDIVVPFEGGCSGGAALRGEKSRLSKPVGRVLAVVVGVSVPGVSGFKGKNPKDMLYPAYSSGDF